MPALRNGDDSYGINVSAPLAHGDASTTSIDPRGLRRYPTLGFELTNVIWRPKTTTALEPAQMLRLDAAGRAALARAMAEQRLVDVPWVLFFHARYQELRTDRARVCERVDGQRRSERHLNDSASLMTGLQTRVTPTDPGYFFGASFIYSAVFRDASGVAGSAAAPPAKVRGNTVRFEVAGLWLARASASIHRTHTTSRREQRR